MADVHDPKTRSYNMSRIEGKKTKPQDTVKETEENVGELGMVAESEIKYNN